MASTLSRVVTSRFSISDLHARQDFKNSVAPGPEPCFSMMYSPASQYPNAEVKFPEALAMAAFILRPASFGSRSGLRIKANHFCALTESARCKAVNQTTSAINASRSCGPSRLEFARHSSRCSEAAMGSLATEYAYQLQR